MAGNATELPRVVDDEDEQEEEEEAKKGGLANVDWDRVCAYKTFKVIKIKDVTMGLLYWIMIAGVVMYTLVVSFCIEGKHQQQVSGVGTVLTKVFGKAFSTRNGEVRVFDPADLRFPVIEPSGAFLLTKQIVVTQAPGSCVDFDSPRRCPCDAGEVCGGEFCQVQAWCPSIGDENADSPPPEARIDLVQGLERIQLKIMSGIAFPGIGNKFFVTGASPDGTNLFKNITLGSLLSLADPPIQVDEELLNTGALIGVSFFWNCDVSQECEPAVVIKRLDAGQGFVQKRVRHYREFGIEKRDAHYMYGLRILVDSSGIGRKWSSVLLVMQIGSALALMRVAGFVADAIMLYVPVYGQKKMAAYYKCKVRETRDFSDLQDRINLIESTKETPGLKEITRPGRASAGVNVSLGLGGGGRAGLASAVLRGRTNV
mmetsp:Transcript_87361/g.151251  ORF Transcript_87361/g.151251 Transcript_87361/m.151251 type:complete len:428 (-) Transcript_87361:73-1356(-)